MIYILDGKSSRVTGRTLTDTSAWANSCVIDGDLVQAVKNEPRDVIITGSLSVVHALMAGDLIDEYRLLTFPTILGTGERLFPRQERRPPRHPARRLSSSLVAGRRSDDD